MHGIARAGAALARSGALRTATTRGLDLVTQVSDAATEVFRNRRDPAQVARRRQVAARRRLVGWSLAALLLAALGATGLVDVVGGDVTAGSIGALVLMLGLFMYCLIGAAHAAIDLRVRTKVVRRLPAPQPARRSVASAIRPLIQRLDGYSDALRSAVGAIGIATPRSGMRQLRDETLAAADSAESRLRAKAAEFTALMRAGRPRSGTTVADTCTRLRREISAGIDEYGRLVVAASGAASASADLAVSVAQAGEMSEVTERLNAMAAGMREISEIAAGDRPAG